MNERTNELDWQRKQEKKKNTEMHLQIKKAEWRMIKGERRMMIDERMTNTEQWMQRLLYDNYDNNTLLWMVG